MIFVRSSTDYLTTYIVSRTDSTDTSITTSSALLLDGVDLLCQVCDVAWSSDVGVDCWVCHDTGVTLSFVPVTADDLADLRLARIRARSEYVDR